MKLVIKEEKRLREQDVEIEVKNKGILEVPEGKNVDDLPMSHFEKLVKKNGLSKITKALNNLQVWNKNDDKKLSKWAGDMIDKLTKKYGKNESLEEDYIDGEYVDQDSLSKRYRRLQQSGDINQLYKLFMKSKGNYDKFVPMAIRKGFSKVDVAAFALCVDDQRTINNVKLRLDVEESLKESKMYDYYDTPDDAFDMYNDILTEEDEWWASIPSELRAVVHEMEEQGWEGVGFTTTGVEYCISTEDKNRPELSYEMCVTIYDRDDSVYISKYVDIFDWDKEKEVSRIPNTSGVAEFRTPQDVRKFTNWFRRLGTSFSTKESVKVRKREQTIDEGVAASLLTIKSKKKLTTENVRRRRKRRK